MVNPTYDVITIGLGAMGAATLNALARAGVRALGIDQFSPPHDRGSTHGETRATRLAVGEGDIYVPLVRRSHVLWRELEARTGVQLLEQCGFLTIDTTGGSSRLHGFSGFFERTIEVANRHGIAHELLDGAAIRDRFPAFAPADGARGYFEPEGGYVHVEGAIAALLDDATAHGAVIHTGERYIGHEHHGGGVTVTTDSGRYSTANLVLAAGPWLPSLVGTSLGQMQLLPQQLHWVESDKADLFEAARFPVFLWLHGATAEDAFYGFPELGSGLGSKMATEQYSSADPSAEVRTIGDVATREAFIAAHLHKRLAVPVRGLRSAGCRYTVSPDAGFIIDWLPTSDRVIVLSACSGHGFKHAPAVGELVARMVCDHSSTLDAFAIERLSFGTR